MTNISRTRTDINRDAILCAARSAFQTYGVTGTSMDKLAEIAQLSKRTVYNHFASKEEIVMHLIRALWSKSMAAVPVVYNANTDLHQQLSEILLAEINLLTTNEYLALARVAFGHFFYHPAKLKEEIEHLSAQETVLKRWLLAATNDGRLQLTDISRGVTILASQIKGQCFWPQMMQIQDPLNDNEKQKIANQTAAVFLSYFAS
ncbi:TetR/AcrR family transcriptional regulator [Alteromonas sp. C1M14]|uniref:TetR/AcrR family transcriptional regulator n=1 Tax=Alteromonas sp. C1M14 TaxID=2841567 RepID=UPI001C0A3FB2|nr:TetR/AcrR family transcriptional regulator [Alteromonas sp. C1M14]MBU2977435.1 TetR/AcrR family transcriptional regulator [Alteromonas sp. C1M14]